MAVSTEPAFDVEIIAKKFVEYKGPGTTCPHTIAPAKHLKVVKETDGDGNPVLKFGKLSLHVGHYQKKETYESSPREPTTLRLEKDNPGTPIRLRVTVQGVSEEKYHAIGICFERADGTPPVGVPFTTGPHRKTNHPFGKVKINEEDNIIVITVINVRRLRSRAHTDALGQPGPDGINGTHRTYRYRIFIQEAETGKIGVIDPEIEDPNDR